MSMKGIYWTCFIWKNSFFEINWMNFTFTVQWSWALQSLLSHLGQKGGECAAPLLSVAVFHEKNRRSFIIWNIKERHCPLLYTHTQLDMDPSYFSIILPLSAHEEQTGFCLLFVYIVKETKLFSQSLAPHEPSLTPVGGDWKKTAVI